LVVPQRKMTLVRAQHGRAAVAGLGAPWPAMGVLIADGREGEWEGEWGGGTAVGHGWGRPGVGEC
jgi:hypothetical protein